ncbi:hypothetical protein ABID23_001333, partial [Bartonella silvatica]
KLIMGDVVDGTFMARGHVKNIYLGRKKYFI